MASLSCRISPRTSTVIFFDRSPLATAIVTSAMLRTCAVRFDAIELTLSVRSFHTPVTSATCAWPPSLPSVPTSRATRVTSEVNTRELLDHRVDDGRRAQELALQRPAVDVEPHGLQEVALGDGGDGAGDFGGRPQQIVDQRVDRGFHLAPGAGREAELDALAGLALAADHLADALELLRHALVGGDDLVEGIGDLADQADMVAGHADGEIADAHGLQGVQEFVQIGRAVAGRGRSAVDFRRGEGAGHDVHHVWPIDRRSRLSPSWHAPD